MKGSLPTIAVALALTWAAVPPAAAQVATGTIAGIVEDSGGAVLPGASVTLTGDRVMRGEEVIATDASGAYRFDRLTPGHLLAEVRPAGLQGRRAPRHRRQRQLHGDGQRRLDVGRVEETITVAGASPTVDVKSNLQQTVMRQEILEGVPTGRDPWSLAKIIPGVQVATYDVGGNQAMQQSALRVHGARDDDKNFAIDGTTVNWPGLGGGSTMLYYDQGMFDEVNYQTSAIPAEVLTGGVYLNMITKSGANRWRGDMKYLLRRQGLAERERRRGLQSLGLPGGVPVTKLYDFNAAGGGALVRNRLWVNGSSGTGGPTS